MCRYKHKTTIHYFQLIMTMHIQKGLQIGGLGNILIPLYIGQILGTITTLSKQSAFGQLRSISYTCKLDTMVQSEIVDLLSLDAGSLQELLTDGRLTSVSLLDQVLSQIAKHNTAGLGLRAVISVAPKEVVFRLATVLDEERANGKIRGPLHGLPLLVKVSAP